MEATLVPDEWVTFLTGVDLQAMAAIGVLAFLMTRSKHVNDEVALWFPTALGGIYGLVEAMSINEQAGGWRLITLVMKGFALNGAAASIIGQGVAKLLGKVWPNGKDAPSGGPSGPG